MAHYAFIKDNFVTEVITGREETDAAPEGFNNWEEYYLTKRPGQDACIRTSYNTLANEHTDGGTPLRGNYAGVGCEYDSVNDVFYPIKSFASWVISEDTNWQWKAPIDLPDNENPYLWNEDTQSWDLIVE
tara:strand:+ start:1127 stop:1516 length:390 start_codon:yes stop_codon:yes gene_type:complete